MRTRVIKDRHVFVNDGKQKWYFHLEQLEFFKMLNEWVPQGWSILFVDRKGEKKYVQSKTEPTPQELYALLG